MINWTIQQTMERHADFMREAEQSRRVREAAMQSAQQRGPRRGLPVLIGSWLVAVGRRMQGQEAVLAAQSKIVILSVPARMGADQGRQR